MLPRPAALSTPTFRRPSILQALDLPAFKLMSTLDDKPSLPSIGHDISRPSSTSTVTSASYSLHHQGSHASVQLPALTALASVASNSPPAARLSLDGSEGEKRAMTPKPPSPPARPSNGHSMTYATAAPTSSSGQANSPPVCQNCSTSTTPLWRRDESGSVLCNACGLFLKLHGRPRPISLKTDVIKSRNRVKTGAQGGRKKPADGNGLPAAHPDADGSLGLAQHRRVSGKISSGLSDRSQSPISRTGTPGLQHSSNIAPQHMFDGVLHPDAYQSPSLPSFLRQPSPGSTSSINGSHLEPPLSYDALVAQNTMLRTRVSELEVINGLFQGRVRELENGEEEARRMELATRATEVQLRAELDEIKKREMGLKRRLDEIQNDGPSHKKMRLSDIVDESRVGTPIGSLGD